MNHVFEDDPDESCGSLTIHKEGIQHQDMQGSYYMCFFSHCLACLYELLDFPFFPLCRLTLLSDNLRKKKRRFHAMKAVSVKLICQINGISDLVGPLQLLGLSSLPDWIIVKGLIVNCSLWILD